MLANLFPTQEQARLLLRRAGIDPVRVDLEGDAFNRWVRALEEAWRLRRLRELVETAGEEYGPRRDELRHAMHRYLDERESLLAVPSGYETFRSADDPNFFRWCFDWWFPRLHSYLTRKSALPLPTNWVTINAYLRDLNARLEHEMHAKTYLPLAATPLPPTEPTLHATFHDPFVSYVHQVILEIIGRSHGGDAVSAPVAAASRTNRVVRNILHTIDRSERPIILLGEPGCGKTMTLQRAASSLAKRETRRIYPRVPVYLRLGEFRADGSIDADAVWRFISRSVAATLHGSLEDLEGDGRLVYFFDGMDEMTRDRYSKHTEALSLFASRSLSKSVFSCRITDFNPEFIHQRLVLLPFDRHQVIEYLRRYIVSFPIAIDGTSWTLKGLADHVVHGDLPIEANNPFVLWLLCLYIQAKRSWPASRVEMLRFYNEENLRRKTEERREDDPPLPSMPAVFSEWARFAYMLTERNRGSAIPVNLLGIDHDPVRVGQMIAIGKLCGVIVESRERSDEHLIRFEHHRFQEFFAAMHIAQERPRINWLDKLDAPRWQETMLNLILMGAGADAVTAFALAIDELSRSCRNEIADLEQRREEYRRRRRERTGTADDQAREPPSIESAGTQSADRAVQHATRTTELHADNVGRTLGEEVAPAELTSDGRTHADSSVEKTDREPELVLADREETTLSERLEVASRLMRQTSRGEDDLRNRLMPPFRDAVKVLAEYGNPITQLKIMRACQNVPDIEFIEALRKPLNSPVSWLRSQALIMIGSSKAGSRAVGSDFATEIGFDLANGFFPKRFAVCWKAAKGASQGATSNLLIAGFCWMINVLLLIGTAGALYYVLGTIVGDATVRLGLPDLRVLNSWTSVLITSSVITALSILALISRPQLLWRVLLGGTAGAITIVAVVPALWAGAWSTFGSLMLALGFGGFAVIWSPITLAASAYHVSTLLIFLGLTRRARVRREPMRTFLAAAATSSGYTWGLTYGALIGVGHCALWPLGWWAKTWLPDAPQHPLLAALAALFFAGAVLSVALVFLTICVYAVVSLRELRRTDITDMLARITDMLALIWSTFRRPIEWQRASIAYALAVAGFATVLGTELILLRGMVSEFWYRAVTYAAVGPALWLGWLIHSGVTGTLRRAAKISAWGLGVTAALVLIEGGVFRLVGNHIVAVGGTLAVAWLVGATVWSGVKFLPKAVVIVLIGGGLVFAAAQAIQHWPAVALWLARFIVAGTCAALLAIYVFFFRRIWRFVRWEVFRVRKFPPGSVTPDEWRRLMTRASASRQRDVLEQTDHQALSVTVPEYLMLLKEIRTAILVEPATSAYWEQRHRIEEALRQERQG